MTLSMLCICLFSLFSEQSLTNELESLRRLMASREEDQARRTLSGHGGRDSASAPSLPGSAKSGEEERLRLKIASLETACADLRQERDRCQQDLLEKSTHLSKLIHNEVTGASVPDATATSTATAALERDNRHLQKLLQRFEGQLSEIQRDLQAVKEERDNLTLLYKQVGFGFFFRLCLSV